MKTFNCATQWDPVSSPTPRISYRKKKKNTGQEKSINRRDGNLASRECQLETEEKKFELTLIDARPNALSQLNYCLPNSIVFSPALDSYFQLFCSAKAFVKSN